MDKKKIMTGAVEVIDFADFDEKKDADDDFQSDEYEESAEVQQCRELQKTLDSLTRIESKLQSSSDDRTNGNVIDFQSGKPIKDKTEMKEKKRFSMFWKIIGNILFYGCIVAFLFVVYNFSTSDNEQKSIFGYRPYTILTESMKSVYPVGSVVIVKITPAEQLAVGDDITFYKPDDTTRPVWTHRIIEIIEDYNGQGLAFRTKGVDNSQPDSFTTLGGNVVGTAVFHIPYVGSILTLASEQKILALVFIVAAFFFLSCIATLIKPSPKSEENTKKLQEEK